MKKWTIKRLVLTGFAAAVLILVLLAGLAWRSMLTSLAVSASTSHSHAVLLATERLSASLALADAAQRSYLLSGDKQALLQREAALNDVHASLDRLTALSASDQEQQARLQQLRQLAPQQVAGMASAAQSERAGSGDAAGRPMQVLLNQMVEHERRLQQQQRTKEQQGMRMAQVSGGLLLMFLAAFLSVLYALITRNIRRDETRMALEKSEALLRQILELLPVGVFVADRDGTLSLVNPAAHDIWGASRAAILKMPLPYQAWRNDNGGPVTPAEYGMARALYHGEANLNQEFEILRDDGSQRILRSSSMPLRDSRRNIIGAVSVSTDITEWRRAEKALQAAHDALEARVAMRTRELVVANVQLKSQIEERRRVEETLRSTQNILTIAQRVAHVGSWEMNLETKEAQWSDEFFRICGLVPGSIAPSIDNGFKLIHPDDHRRISAIVQQAIDQRREYSAEVRAVRPDGTIRHVLLQGEPVCRGDEAPTILIGSMLDVTEQRQNEELLRQLAVHQQTIKEEERKRIAREIHDEMGQNLLALRIDVSMLHARTAGRHDRLHKKVETVLANIDNTIKSVRGIINNLRPVVLDLGLYASFQWQIKEFQRRNNIVCELFARADELDSGLTEAQTTTLFRILQESLTNVARHANASCVHISLQRKEGNLHMRIADDGVGMYPNERRKAKSFGLIGIRERISAIGGTLDVESTVGQGTILMLTIPLNGDLGELDAPPHEEPPRLQA